MLLLKKTFFWAWVSQLSIKSRNSFKNAVLAEFGLKAVFGVREVINLISLDILEMNASVSDAEP